MNEQDGLKLYIKSSCSVCLNGIRKGVFVNCPYCDEDSNQVIEASFNVIKSYLSESLTEEQKDDLIKALSK